MYSPSQSSCDSSRLAIVGMGCRAPGCDNVDELWNLILKGEYAINRVPSDRYNRDIYYDPNKGVKGKSYMNHGGLIDYTAFDPKECRFPSRLMDMCDVGSLEMCRVAAAACRDAGINPFRVSYPNTGVYLGSTVVGTLGHESVYTTMCPNVAHLFHEVPTLRALAENGKISIEVLISSIIDEIRRNGAYPSRSGHNGPLVQSIALAVSESLELTGPSILLDAACSSSLNALGMAERDLKSGQTDMAIIGGGTFFSQENLILFSNAQSGSPDGSFPFSDRANGLISSEAYVALVVKTLGRAIADGDRIHAIVHGIGLSSDGKGRSHWAPRVEGQIEAMKKAYASPEDRRRLAYYEAHATSTPVGDRTELEAVQAVFGDFMPEKCPIGSIKGNIGHPLESAGGVGLIKAILVLKNNTIPPQCGAYPLNKDVDWDKLAFFVPDQPRTLPPSKDGRPRLAAVSAFGVGGINAHVVIEEPTDLLTSPTNRRIGRVAEIKTGAASSTDSTFKNTETPIAVIGAGAVFPGARTLQAFESLILSGADPKQDVPADRWNREIYVSTPDAESDPWKTTICRGGFVTDFQYDWKRHKIPPKQLENGNPLQFMILDAVDAALDAAGYATAPFGASQTDAQRKVLDNRRTSVFVGSTLGTDFLTDLTLSFRLVPFRNLVQKRLRELDVKDPETLDRIEKEFTDVFFKHNKAFLDETGGFTASSLASRITKVYDLMGGCVTLDAGSASALAALDQGMKALRENQCDLVLCASGSRNMLPGTFLEKERQGLSTANDPLPAEGAGVVVLKRLDDAVRDGDSIRCVLHGIGKGFADDAETAFDKAIEQAWDATGLPENELAALRHVELSSACGAPLEGEVRSTKRRYSQANVSNLAKQIGDVQAASGMAALLKASMSDPSGEKSNQSDLAAVSAWDQAGIAYHLVLDRNPVTVSRFAAKTQTDHRATALSESVSEKEKYEIVRFGARSREELQRQILAAVAEPRLERYRDKTFRSEDVFRLGFVVDDEQTFIEQLLYVSDNFSNPYVEKLLARKNIFYGKVESETKPGKIAFLCSGQGSQYEGMLKPIVDHSPAARVAIKEVDAALTSIDAPGFAELAWSQNPKLGKDVKWTQLSLFAADMLLCRSAEKMGIVPDVVAGHSYGEFPALTVAGSWSMEQGAQATSIRCDAISGCRNARGKLLVTQLNEIESKNFCREMNDEGLEVHIANLNAPKQTVLGATESIAVRAVEILSQRKISTKILEVPRPFHTPIMAEVRGPLYEAMGQVPARKPVKRFLSSVSNEFETDSTRIRRNLADQMTVPVRYVALVERLVREGYTALVECGPGNVLTGIHQKIIAEKFTEQPILCLTLDSKGQADSLSLFVARASLEVRGYLDKHEPATSGRPVHDSRFEWGKSHAESIRLVLRRQADTATGDLSQQSTVNANIPPFLVGIASGAGVCVEPLFAYWKNHGDDQEVFPPFVDESERSKTPVKMVEPVVTPRRELPETISFAEYVRILRSWPEIPDENTRRHASRFVPRLVETPMVKADARSLPVAGRILILGDSPLGLALQQRLQALGHETVVLRVEGTVAEIRDKIAAISAQLPTPHCFYALNKEDWDDYHQAASSWETLDGRTPDRWKELRERRVLKPFAAIQAWYGELVKQKNLFEKGSFYAATFLGGDSGFSGNGDLCGGVLTGMAKAIFLEAGLTTQNTFRSTAIDFSCDIDAQRCAELLLDEWTYGPPIGEIGYTGERRRMIFNVPDFPSEKTDQTIFTGFSSVVPLPEKLRPRGTWIVTGGARGVTAYTARTLAKQYGIKLHLLGSSPIPEVPAEWIGLDESGKKELQKSIMLKARQGGRNPITEWSRVDRSIGLAESLKDFERDGISYVYHLCDVTNIEKLTETVENIRATDGPITGILHGAGVDYSCAFQKKDPANVEKTYAVKTDAAANLMFLTRQDPIRHFIAFGSSSGRLGSYGQTDYSLANDVLAKLVRAYAVQRPDCLAFCFDWGAWDEIGMAMRPESKNSIAVKEYFKLPPADALQFLNEEISYNGPDREILVCDWKALLKWFVPICQAAPEEFSKSFSQNNPDATPADLMKGAFAKSTITQIPQQQTASPPPPTQFDKKQNVGEFADRKMKRMLVRMVPQERTAHETEFSFAGKAVIYGDNVDAQALAKQLSCRSIPCTLLPESEDESAMEAFVRKEFADDTPLHLFFMSSRNPAGLREANCVEDPRYLSDWQYRRQVSMEVPAVLMREWLKIVHRKKLLDKASVAAAVSLGGNYAVDDLNGTGPIALEGALLGSYLKGLYHENGGPKRDGLTIRVLDAPVDESPEVVAKTLIAELGSGSRGDRLGIESAVVGGRHFVPRIVDAEFSDQKRQTTFPPITRGGTWIITGGARGITAETVKRLAPYYGLKIHLLGTLPLPNIDPSLRFLSDEELEPYKQRVIKEALQTKQLPDKVWEAFRRELEIDRNLRRMKELGIDVTYHQCDVTEPRQLKNVVDAIRSKDGPIRGVIHGAGFAGNASMVRTTTPVNVRAGKTVVNIKMDASLVLLELLKNDPLEVFLGFGSVSGRFGAGSVSAYCAGNDAMCKLMRVVRRWKPNCRAIGFHWHAWDEVGMTMRPISYGSVKVLKMTLLSPKEGTLRILEELEYGGGESEVVISDDQYFSQSFSGEMLYDLSSSSSKTETLPLVEKVADEARGKRVEVVWNPTTEPLIAAHRLTDKPILPAALMMETMLEAYTISNGLKPDNPDTAFAVHGFEIAEGLRFFSDAPQTMRAIISPSDRDPSRQSCRLLSTFANSKGVVLNPNRFHAAAEISRVSMVPTPSGFVLPGSWKQPLDELRRFGTARDTRPMKYVPKGSVMYHGPVLQELQWIDIEGDRVWGESITQPMRQWIGNRSAEHWLTRPASFDACLYLCGAATWIFFEENIGLPKGAETFLFARPPREGERCRLFANKIEQTNTSIRYDFCQIGEDGALICMALGYYCQILLSSPKGAV